MSESPSLPQNWQRPFFTIWSGQVFSLLGSQIVQFSLVWWLTQTTGSAAVLAFSTFAALLPQVLLAPFAGALVDRWNRRLVMICSDSFVALLAGALVVLFWTGQIQVWHIYLIGFLRALGGAFHYPAMQASTSLMVPHKQLTRIAGMNQTLYGALNIVAPPLAAFLIGVLPMHAVIMIDVFTAWLAVAPLLFTAIPQPARAPRQAAITPQLILRDIQGALRYLRGWTGILLLLMGAAGLNFFLSPGFSLMPLVVKNIFNGGAIHLGMLESAGGFGIIAGGLLLSLWGGFKRRTYTSLLGVFGLGIGVLAIGMAPAGLFWLVIAGRALAGFMMPIANGPIQAILQSRVAPEMQGRVFTLASSLSGLMMPLGLMVAAPVAELLGLRIWYWIGGGACLLIGVLFALNPAIAAIDQPIAQPAHAEGGEAGSQPVHTR